MADKDTLALTEAAALTGAEVVHIVQEGNSRRVDLQAIADLGGGGGGGSNTIGSGTGLLLTGATASVNFYLAKLVLATEDFVIDRVAFATEIATPACVYKPFVYAATPAGVAEDLLAAGDTVTGVDLGYNSAALTSPVTLTKGNFYWVGINTTVAAIAGLRGSLGIGGYAANGGSPVPSDPGPEFSISGTTGASSAVYAIWGEGEPVVAGGGDPAVTGWQTSLRYFNGITATATGAFMNNINAALNPFPVNSFYWQNSAGAQNIVLDFGVDRSQRVTGFRIFQDVVSPQGYWSFQGSDDNENWTDLDTGWEWAPVSANGAVFLERTFENPNAYRYYRFTKTAGSTNTAPYINWFHLLFAA